MSRTSRRRYAAWSAAAVAVLTLGTALDAAPAVASTPKNSTVPLASGVTFRRTNFTITDGGHKYKEQTVTLSVTLSSHTSLDAAYAGNNRVSVGHGPLSRIAAQEHAIAGVSGNVFLDKYPHSAGDGGVTHQGTIVKSELKGKDDSLWVDNSGHAHVGDPGFDGHLTAPVGNHVIHVSSVNYVDNAAKGAVTILDYHEAPVTLPSCLMATFVPTAKNTYQVKGVYRNVKHFGGLTGSARALVSCGSHQVPWLSSFLKPGITLTGSWGYAVPHSTLISGASHIVHSGKPYNDPHGIPATIDKYQKQHVPVDFACVMTDTTKVLMGSVVGWRDYSAGMTYAELSRYLVGRGCREAIALNALYDSETVAKAPGKALAVTNPKKLRGENPLVSGLMVTIH